ncbi:MAG: hypothetical protein K1X72_28690 [Pyrinomonadaceae bacterium]|nr:hypothetical protein [Pyrinomonadaceae bacterium]
MFRKISNYFAVFSLSLMILGSSVLANPNSSTTGSKTKAVVVNVDKDSSFYNDFLTSGGKHTYTVKVDKQTKIKIHSSRGLTLKVQTPNGETKTYQDKYFDVNLLGEGEYTIEVSSIFISQYSLEVFNK